MVSITPDYNSSDYEEPSVPPSAPPEFLKLIRMQYIAGYLIILCLGAVLNLYVITAGCYNYHKVNKSGSSVWVLGLAIIHLVFSGFLVPQFLYAWHDFNWHYGAFLCKFSSYVFYASMFSTAILLSLWSISSSVSSSRCSKCLRRTFCSRGTSAVTVLILGSCTLGAVLSIPSLLSRELRDKDSRMQCIDDYDLDKQRTTNTGKRNIMIVVLGRFLLGILVPVFIMITSACLARRQGPSHVDPSKKRTKRIACAVKVAYFVCWTPLLSLSLLQISGKEVNSNFFRYGLPIATVLASAHCFINPVIYLLLGCKFSMSWMSKGRGTADQNDQRMKMQLL